MALIACFYRDFNSQGGIPLEMQCFMEEVVCLGHDAIVYCYGTEDLQEKRAERFVMKQYKHNKFFFDIPGGMKKDIQNNVPDLVFMVQGHLLHNFGVSQFLSKRAIRYVFSPSGAYVPYLMNKKNKVVKELWRNFFELKILNNAEVIRTYSKTQENYISAYGGKRPFFELLEGIYEPDLPKEIKPYSFSGNQINLVYLGRIDYYGKGLDQLLKAMKKVIQKNLSVKLHLFGPFASPEDEILLKEALKELEPKFISYQGPLYGEEKYDMLSKADLFVYPSRFEGIPRSIRESLYFGVPVLVTPETNFAEYVESYKAGYSCSCEAGSIFEAIERFSLEQNDDLKSNAKKLLKEHYTWSQVRMEMDKLFTQLGIESTLQN